MAHLKITAHLTKYITNTQEKETTMIDQTTHYATSSTEFLRYLANEIRSEDNLSTPEFLIYSMFNDLANIAFMEGYQSNTIPHTKETTETYNTLSNLYPTNTRTSLKFLVHNLLSDIEILTS